MDFLPECRFNPFDDDTRALLLQANRSLNKLDSILDVVPDSGFSIELLMLQESLLSCSIENIVTSQDEVFRAYSTGEGCAKAGIRDVLGCRRAIAEAENEELSVDLFERICSTLKGSSMRIRSVPGDIVNLVTTDGEIVYSPPRGDRVPELLAQLIEKTVSSEDDPLIRMIVFHAYFEIIHPFKDGNGRTGRILNEMILQQTGLLKRPVLNLSRFLIDNRREYYRQIRRIEDGKPWDTYVRFMLSGINESADSAALTIRRIYASLSNAYEVCGKLGFSKDIVDQLYSHPYIRVKHLVDAGLVSRNTDSDYLERLVGAGILRGEKAGRGRTYINVELFEILAFRFGILY